MFKYTKILFIVNPFHKESHPVFLQTLITCQSKSLKCFLEKPVLEKLLDPACFGSYEEIEHVEVDAIEALTITRDEADLAIAFGGDGTILHFSKLYYNSTCPTPDLLSFNFGSLGYLCSFEIEDVSYVLRSIFGWKFDEITSSPLCLPPLSNLPRKHPSKDHLSRFCHPDSNPGGNFSFPVKNMLLEKEFSTWNLGLKQEQKLEEPERFWIGKMNRQRLGVKVQKANASVFELELFVGVKSREPWTTELNVLNEINLTSRKALETVKLEVSINGKYLTTYEGTGLVFSTPTGSTSYNLSLHGAIIQNDIECIGMIGIWNAASISMKPLILPSDVVITVKNVSEDDESTSHAVWDGSLIFEFNPGDTVTISGSKSYIPQLMKTSKDPIKDWVLRLKEKLSLFEY